MAQTPYGLRLDYLREYQLGDSPGRQRRNVPLKLGHVDRLSEREDCYNHDAFSWWQARRLEGREDVADSEGIWPINGWRCERRIGLAGSDVFEYDDRLSDATPDIYSAALEMRRLCYTRVVGTDEAEEVIGTGRDVRYASEVTSEWYDPPAGTIQNPAPDASIVGSHAVPLFRVDRSAGDYFVFPNSWGGEWGFKGMGAISFDHFERFMIEAWLGGALGLHVPYQATEGVTCLEWKWSISARTGVHGRELVDAKTSERLAWAFCVRRGGALDLEEFFVWPTERGKGYGRELSRMVERLRSSMGTSLRAIVSFADTEPENIQNLDACGRLLGVHYEEAPDRFAHLIGRPGRQQTIAFTARRPMRPALMLELLRPKDEKPVEESVDYSVVFGTNRQLERDHGDQPSFGPARDSILHTGVAKVAIPRSTRFGSKGSAWARYWRWLTNKRPKVLESRLFQSNSELSDHVRGILEVSGGEQHNLLFVHGYRCSFDDAVKQGAQLGVDLKIPGTTFVFSWPSAASVFSYQADEASVEAAGLRFEEFFESILRSTGDVPLNVVVHSMGNRAVLRMLENWARSGRDWGGRLRNVVCAAPDVDTEAFLNHCQSFRGKVARTTLYASRGDIPLQVSEVLHQYARAGLAPPVVTAEGVETVLVEGFNLLEWAHGYYAEADSLLHDLFTLLHYGSEAKSRPGLVATETQAGQPYWKLAR